MSLPIPAVPLRLEKPPRTHGRECYNLSLMSTQPDRITHIGSGVDLAFAVVVSFSYLATFSTSIGAFTTRDIFLLILLGIAYIALGIYGFNYCLQSGEVGLAILYFVLQIPLSGAIVYLGKGAGFNALLMLPLAGHAVVLLARRGTAVVSGAILLTYVLVVYWFGASIAAVWAGLPTFIGGLALIVVFTQIIIDERRARAEIERLAQELSNANTRLREYAVQAEELAITKERNRLAREIHDGLGHYLTTVCMQIQAAQAVLPKDRERAADALEKAEKLAQEALIDVRRSVSALRTLPEESRPLPELVEPLLEECRQAGVQAEFCLTGEMRELQPQVELTLYRTVQESLNNVRKHARAEHTRVSLDYSGAGQVRLVIEDDGVGTEAISGGYGILGLRERAHLLGGDIQIVTGEGKGFRLTMEVPA